MFDLRKLYGAVDAERRRRNLSWSALARQVGVSTSTVRRYAAADDAEADGVLALVRWLAVAPERFVATTSIEGELLPPSGKGQVRVDMELIAQANGDPRGAHGRTRTTVQILVRTSQRSGRSVASLTRLCQT